MSSINPHFTFEYSQPAEYHFSHDSVFLARRVFETLNPAMVPSLRGLDLCAGCGIVGLDLIYHSKKAWGVTPASFDFFEVQEIYQPHFVENLSRGEINAASVHFVAENYSRLLEQKHSFVYDLIVCNPPYFRQGQGKLSPSEFKSRCRFFIDSDFTTLLLAIKASLSERGVAYVLLRDLADHGWYPKIEAEKILGADMLVESLEDIRGTGLISIKRNAR